MTPEARITVFACVVLAIALVILWRMERKPSDGVIGERIDDPSKDTDRKHDAGFWS